MKSKASFFRRARGLVLANGLGHALYLVSIPILTRMYGQDAFGEFGAFTSFVGITSGVVCLLLDQAILTVKRERPVALLAAVALRIAVLMSALVVAPLVVVLLVSEEPSVFGLNGLSLMLAVPVLISVAVNNCARADAARQSDFNYLGRLPIVLSVSRGGLQSAFGVAAIVPGLLVGESIARALVAIWSIQRVGSGLIARVSLRAVGAVLNRYRSFVLFGSASTLVNNASLFIPGLLIPHAYGLTNAGVYLLAYQALMLPVTIVGRAIGDAYIGRLRGQVEAGEVSEARGEFWLLLGILALIGGIPLLLVLPFAEELFALVFGASWVSAGGVARVMGPWAFVVFVVSSLSRLIYVVGHVKRKLIFDVVLLLGIIGTFQVAASEQLNFISMLTVLVSVQVMAYTVYVFILYSALKFECGRDV